MKIAAVVLGLFLFGAGAFSAEMDQAVLSKLSRQLGEKFWSPPEKRLVRATIYKKGKGGSDPESRRGESNEKIGLRYASAKEAGTLAVPNWLPRGSMVKIHTEQGVLSYIAADEGSGVENRTAARELGKTEEEKAAPVLDFCAAERLWPDFVIVEIYYFAGKVAFSELSLEDQKTLFQYAMEYVTKRE